MQREAGPEPEPVPLADSGSDSAADAGCATAGEIVARRTIIGPYEQRVLGLAVAPNGDWVATGSLAGTIDLGGGPVTLEDLNNNFFLARWDAQGGYGFATYAASSQGEGAFVAADGSVTVVLNTWAEIDLGGGPLGYEGDSDIVLARFAADGAPIFSRRFGDFNVQWAFDVVSGVDGGSYVLGGFQGTLQLADALLYTSTEGDTFVASFDAQGELRWAERLGQARASAFAAAPNGDLFVAGALLGSVDFGGGLITPTKTDTDCCLDDLFLLKLDAAGEYQFARTYAFGRVDSMAVDSSGDLLLSGVYSGALDFGGGPLPPAAASERPPLFVARLKSDGEPVFSRAPGVTLQVQNMISAGLAGSAFVAVGAYDTAELDCGTLSPIDPEPQPTGDPDLLMLELDARGNVVWARRYGGPFAQFPEALTTNLLGHPLVAAAFETGIDLEGEWLIGAEPDQRAPDDIVLLELAP